MVKLEGCLLRYGYEDTRTPTIRIHGANLALFGRDGFVAFRDVAQGGGARYPGAVWESEKGFRIDSGHGDDRRDGLVDIDIPQQE